MAVLELPPGEYPGKLKSYEGIEYEGVVRVSEAGNVSFYDETMDLHTHICGPDSGENPYVEYVKLDQEA